MNPFDALGAVWGRLKRRSRRFQQADEHPVQTHINHALVIILLFGSLGVGLAQLVGRTLEQGIEHGLVAGWLFYVAREFNQRLEITEWLWCNVRGLTWIRFPSGIRFAWRNSWWDGICDVLVPALIIAPVVFHSVRMLWALAVVVAVMYFVLRPIEDGVE